MHVIKGQIPIALFAFSLAARTASGAPASPLVIAPGASASCPILLAADATPAEQFAAQELSTCLTRICGAAFPVTNAPPPAGPALALAADASLGAEEYRVRADAAAGRLTVSGGRPRGVLYGVYALLEDHLGCRWYTREVERVPRLASLSVPADLDLRGKPRLEYREVFWTEAFDGDWAARNRLNSNSARLEDRHGGKVAYGPFVHTFASILDPGKHFATHPEYFSMVNGKRIQDHTQLCLSNPEVLDHAIRTVREWIKANPKATIFSVSQNDWQNPCQCPACKAIDDAEESHAGSLIAFVNKVAEAIEKDHPGVAIDTLAYQYTRKPPKTVRPRPNVIVRLCSIECCFAHPLDGCPEKTNTSFMEDLRGWNRLTSRLYVWDYTTDFAHYLLPFPNLDVLDDNVRAFVANGVVGLFEQGAYSPGGGAELAELRSWVLAKLLWDPSRDGEALIREFVVGAYGPAAPAVQRHLDLRREAARRAGNHVRIFDGVNRPDLAPADVRAWDGALAEAARIATDAGDAGLVARVKRLRMPVWYTQVWQSRESADAIRAAASGLKEAAVEFKLTHFREWRGLEADLQKLDLAIARKPRAVTPGVLVGEDFAFGLHREGDLVSLAADPKAGDGVAARMAGRTTEWAAQWRFPVPPEAPAGRYSLRVHVRVDRAGAEGQAFHVGAYDGENRKGLGQIEVSAKDAPEGEYRTLDVATFELGPGRYAYIAPDDNEKNVKAIWIDRFELVPAPAETAPQK